MQQGYKTIATITKNPAKFQQKIKNKQFLLGKYFNIKQELNKKKNKPKCFCKAKTEKLMNIQEGLVGKKQQQKDYKYFMPLHKLWQSYMSELIYQQKSQQSCLLKILRSDFHGSHLTVIHTKVQSCLGIAGIVIKQTLKTFVIMTQVNKVITIIKSPHIFMLTINNRSFVVNGGSLIYRPSDRAKHKFKFKKAESLNFKFLEFFLQQDRQPKKQQISSIMQVE